MLLRRTSLFASALSLRGLAARGIRAAGVAGALFLMFGLVLALDKPVRRAGADAPPYVPNELLVKFKDGVAAQLQRQLDRGQPVAAIELSDSLDRLSASYRVRCASPVFKNFPAVRQRLQILELKDRSVLTETEQRLLNRRRRAPPHTSVPALDRIYKLELEPGISVEAAVADFGNDLSVEYAEPNYLFFIDLLVSDPYTSEQWALHNIGQWYLVPGIGRDSGTPDSDIDALEAWDAYAPTGPVIVAIVDSGVDYNHPDLTSQMWTDGDGHYGYDFVNDDDDPMDDLGHGTHCAGIVAAGLGNGVGISGICSNARIMALKFLDEDGRGPAGDAAQAVYYAVNHGADVVSNSYSYYETSETLRAAIDYAYSQGVILVGAAGNKARSLQEYPASYDHMIAVAATDSHDVKAVFSTYGNWVDISAPGVDILSLRAAGTDMYGDGRHIIGTDYYIASGTSMACPHVAGVAAMIVSHYPDLSSQEITARLLGTTDGIAGQNPTYAHLIGSGRANAYNALTDEEHPAIIFVDYEILDDTSGNGNGLLDPGETASLVVALKNVWTDAADVQATLETSNPYATVNTSWSQYGVMLSGQMRDNATAPFEITLSHAAPPDAPVEFSLAVTAGGGYSRLLGFAIMREIGLQEGDWPKYWGAYVQPVPYDVDGDGLLELILQHPATNTVRIYKHDGSIAAELGNGRDSFGNVLVGDIQRDGHVEIVTVCRGAVNRYPFLRLWDKNGSEICPPFYPSPPHVFGTPTLYDLDDDGDLEIIFGGKNADSDEIVVRSVEWQGSALETQWATFLQPLEGWHRMTHIAVGDIDGTTDGCPELVFGTGGTDHQEGSQLFALHSDGRIVEGWPVLLAYGGPEPVLADLTGDGNLDIVVNMPDRGHADGLQAWDHTGSLLWAADGSGASPVIADLDGNGDLEVLTQVRAFHHDGTDTGWTYSMVGPSGASVGDVDGDGDMEVLIGGAGSDGLRGFHYDGSPIAGFPLFIDPWGRDIGMTPVLADLDGDGDIEITVTGHHLAVWDLHGDYDPSKIEWSMHHHDPYRTGCYNAHINFPPVWFAAPEDQIFVRSVQNEIYVQATDPEGKSVTYQILDAPAGAHYEPEGDGLHFQWQPQGGDSGQEVTFWATDEDGERIAKTIHIAVVNILIDFDGDGDMDQKDYQRFCGCFLGPDEPIPVPICHQADFDQDGNVDLRDFAILQIEFGALSP